MRKLFKAWANWLGRVMYPPEPKEERVVRYYGSLDPRVLQRIAAKANANTIVNSSSTELQVAYQLGMQHVLNIIAQDFTIEAPSS